LSEYFTASPSLGPWRVLWVTKGAEGEGTYAYLATESKSQSLLLRLDAPRQQTVKETLDLARILDEGALDDFEEQPPRADAEDLDLQPF
jgi:hypothetical protein